MPYGSLRRRAGRNSQEGYILLIFLVVLTMMMIALTAAAPRLAQQLQRDRGLYLSIGRLWLALQKMGLRLKKSRSTRKNKRVPQSRRDVSSAGKR